MNKTVLGVVIVIATATLIGFYIYSQSTRYYIQSAMGGPAYKIDRKTGQTWAIYGEREHLVERTDSSIERKSPKEKAIELAKKSSALGGYGVEATIQQWMEQKKGDLRIIGWKAQKINDQIYLVSYTFNEDSGPRGYFFEVNLVGGIVRNVLGDPELEQKYGIE